MSALLNTKGDASVSHGLVALRDIVADDRSRLAGKSGIRMKRSRARETNIMRVVSINAADVID